MVKKNKKELRELLAFILAQKKLKEAIKNIKKKNKGEKIIK